MCASVLEPNAAARSCSHPDAEILGFDANAEFLRCVKCGHVLVVQRSRTWAILPARNPVLAIR